MIYGIGCDITAVGRFERWAGDGALLGRFFAPEERLDGGAPLRRRCEHYAARFAAKEAFGKALGTGLCGFALREVYVEKDAAGKPSLRVTGAALRELCSRCGAGARVHLSLSHEREYAVAYIVIERG